MELAIADSGKDLSVSDSVFGREFSEDLVHQVVVAFRNAGRAGTKAQKTRSDVAGTTKKSKKQKGGGARHGALTAPIFVGGGRAFAGRPRSFAQKVNRKMYRGALRSILSELVRQDRLLVVDAFTVGSPKTKELVAKLAELGANDALIVTENFDENLLLASRNLYHIDARSLNEVDPVSLIGFEKVIMTAGALKALEEKLA